MKAEGCLRLHTPSLHVSGKSNNKHLLEFNIHLSVFYELFKLTVPVTSHRHPKLLSLAQTYARTLSQLEQDAPKRLQPRDVVMEVAPKVIHGLWLPPASSSLDMPSRQLSTVAVGLTQSVLDRVSKTLSTMLQHVHFSRSVRDQVVQTVLEKVSQMYPRNSLETRLSCFAIDLLRSITSATSEEICKLFEPPTEPDVDPEPDTELDSGSVASPLPLPDERPEDTVLQEISIETLPQPAKLSVPESASPPPEAAVQEITVDNVQPQSDSIDQASSGLFGFFRWLQKSIWSWFLPEEVQDEDSQLHSYIY